MLAAILDGTLEAGERLQDDELSSWLGVSRTPIREALTRLAADGLVEIVANKSTRVAPRDHSAFLEASQLLGGLHELGLRWGRANLSSQQCTSLRSDLAQIADGITRQSLEAPRWFLDVLGEVLAASGNGLLVEAEQSLRARVKFLSPRHESDYDWDALDQAVSEIHASLGVDSTQSAA